MLGTTLGFYTLHETWPLLRQTPGGAGVWADRRFLVNPPSAAGRGTGGSGPDVAEQLDWLVVYDDLAAPLATPVPRARRIFVVSEPPGVKTYAPRFLRQFGHVISPQPCAGYVGNTILSHSALPWHFGLDMQTKSRTFPTLEALAALPCPDKLPGLSVVCSDKVITPEHRRRLVFLDKLKQVLGDRVAHFGRGFREINDKAEAILPYQFHLVLENNRQERGWTEKLADAYLGWAFPVFSGGPGLDADFPADAFAAVDLDDHDQAIATIVRLLETPGFYQQHQPQIAGARQLILEHHNLFAVLDRIVTAESAPVAVLSRLETLYPGRLCSRRRRVKAAVRGVVRALRHAG